MILSICGDITKNLLQKNVTAFVQKKKKCFLHEELQKLTDYINWICDRNLNENIIVTKIALVFEKDSTRKEAFWWYNQKIWDEKHVPDNVTMSWREQFVQLLFFFEEPF